MGRAPPCPGVWHGKIVWATPHQRPSSNGYAVARMPPQSSLRRMKIPSPWPSLPQLCFVRSSSFLSPGFSAQLHPSCENNQARHSSWTSPAWTKEPSCFGDDSQLKLTKCFKKQNSSSQCGYLIASMFYVMNNISHLQSKISRQMPSFLPAGGGGGRTKMLYL